MVSNIDMISNSSNVNKKEWNNNNYASNDNGINK